MSPRGRRPLVTVLAWWLPITVVGEILIGVLVRAYPVVASREGAVSDESIFYLLRFVVPIGALILTTLVVGATAFRARTDAQDDAPVQTRHAGWVWAWLGLSTALTVSFILHPGVTGLVKIWRTERASDPLVIEVTARQWEWRFAYPDLGVPETTELVLPVDRPVEFVIRSEDVIHSFWVPSLRIKKDAIPGETRRLYLTPDRILATAEDPMMRVQCAELCGVGHARMRAAARIVSGDDFGAWAEEQRGAMGANDNGTMSAYAGSEGGAR